jgi:hypothetical protein
MTVPTMIVTASSVAQIIGDGVDVGSDVDVTALAGMEFDFICNIPAGTMIPGDGPGDVWLVSTVKGRVNEAGVLCRVNADGTIGATGVALLAADALNLTRPLQWKCHPGRVLIAGRWVRPRSWWFNAQPGGTTVTLRSLVPVDGAITMPTVPDPPPAGGEVTEEAVVEALGITGVGLALVRAVNYAAVQDLIDAVTAAELASAVNTAVTNLIGGAPAALDSFLELAAAIGNDPTFAADVQSQITALQNGKANAADLAALTAQFDGMTTALEGKANTVHTHTVDQVTGLQAQLDGKVDKVAGKALSTEDYTTAEKSKLGGVAAGATANATDTFLRARGNHTGTQSADTLTDGGTNRLYSSAEKTKLAGVATGATANATDAQLRDRSTHTGQQTSASISDLAEAVQDIVAGFLTQGTNVSLSYDDAGNTLTVNAAGGGGGLDAEAVRDAIGVALVGLGNINVTVNDAADTITITTTATVNSTDAALRDRSTHTGTQPASTITETASVKMMTDAERTKLSGIANGATANATDTFLRDRGNHTGTQSADTLTDGTNNKVFTAAEKTKLAGIANGGNDARILFLEANIGNGTIGPYTITHGFNTRTVIVDVTKNVGGVSLTGALQGQHIDPIDWQRDPANDKNAIIIKPDEPIGANELHVLVMGIVGSSDMTAPTAPTLTVGTITSNSIQVTPSGATDAVGVTAYNYFLNGAYVGTATGAFTFTGLNPNTQYTITATAIDAAGNASPASVAVTPTTNLANVTASHTFAGTAKPAAIPDWNPQALGAYSVSGGVVQSGSAPAANGLYWGGGVHTTQMATPLHSSSIVMGTNGSSPRKAGPAVAGSDANFTNGVFAGAAGFNSGNSISIYTKQGTTITERAWTAGTVVGDETLQLKVTFNGTNYVYSLYKNGNMTTPILTWTDTGNVHTPGRYGGFAVMTEYASGQYGSPGIKGTITIADN